MTKSRIELIYNTLAVFPYLPNIVLTPPNIMDGIGISPPVLKSIEKFNYLLFVFSKTMLYFK